MELIYQNTNEIENIKNRYNNYCSILNENAEKIIAYNKLFNNKDFIIYTLSFHKFKTEIYNLICDILKEESKFFAKDFVAPIYREIEQNLLYNEYLFSNGFLIGNDYSKANKNIRQVTLTYNEIDKIRKVLNYDKINHTFSVNEKELNKEIDKHIFFAKNQTQLLILKKIKEFNKVCKDLFDMDIGAYNYLNPYKDVIEIEMNEDLAKEISRK